MKITQKYALVVAASTGMLFAGVSALADTFVWTGAGVDPSDFAANDNWETASGNATDPPGVLDLTSDTQYSNDSENIATYSGAGLQQVKSISIGNDGDGRLDVTAGTLQGDGQNNRYSYGINGNSGTLNVSGTGTVDSGGSTRLGLGRGLGSVGTINLSGSGTYLANRGADVNGILSSISLGIDDGCIGIVTISGSATFKTRFAAQLGNGDTGVGNFTINGGDAAIELGILHAASEGVWHQSAGSTLAANVDALGSGISTVVLVDRAGVTDGALTFQDGALLELGFMGDPPETTQTWTLMRFADDIAFSDFGLKLSAGTASEWSFAWVDTGGTADVNELQITYTAPYTAIIPEPSTYVLLAGYLALTAVMFRRRK